MSWITLLGLLAVLNFVCVLLSFSFLAYALAQLRCRNRGLPLVVFAIIVAAQVWLILQVIVSLIMQQDVLRSDFYFTDRMVTAFGIVLLWLVLRDISPARFDAARLDGLSSFGIYWHVVVPLVRPALILLGIFVLLFTGTDVFAIFVSPPPHLPKTLPTASWADIASALPIAVGFSTLWTLPLLAIFFLVRKMFPPCDSFENLSAPSQQPQYPPRPCR